MKFEETEVFNFKGALRGMRNPWESWIKTDSYEVTRYIDGNVEKEYVIGENDMELAQRLIRAGSEHRKFMRQIFVSVDITAPMYWWSEFDTYHIFPTANSTSKMHKLADTPITKDCFEIGDYKDTIWVGEDRFLDISNIFEELVYDLEQLRIAYIQYKDKKIWKELIRLLPESWLQTRTVSLNYENVYCMVKQRKGHKLREWSVDFMQWVESLPYAKELLLIK